jgi:hypothetical protein
MEMKKALLILEIVLLIAALLVLPFNLMAVALAFQIGATLVATIQKWKE